MARQRVLSLGRVAPGQLEVDAVSAKSLPLVWQTLEFVVAASLELDAGPVDKVADHAGHEHLTRLCERGYASAHLHGDTCEVVTSRLALSRVQTGAELEFRHAFKLAKVA